MRTRSGSRRKAEASLLVRVGRLALCASLPAALAAGGLSGWAVGDASSPAKHVSSLAVAYQLNHRVAVEAGRVGGKAEAQVRFDLPDSWDVRRGWFMIDAQLRVGFDQSVQKPATGAVMVGANDRAIILDLNRNIVGGSSVAWWGVDTLTEGFTGGGTLGSSTILHIRDYLTYRALRRGMNDVFIRAYNFSGHLIRSVALLPGSRLLYARAAPARLQLVASTDALTIRVGGLARVRYSISDQGLPARNVGLFVGHDTPGLIGLQPPTRYLGEVQRASGVLRFQGVSPGVWRVMVGIHAATGLGNDLVRSVRIRVDP